MTLLDLSPDEARAQIGAWTDQKGLPGYRTRQILPRLWSRPVAGWRDATDLPGGLRDDLDATYPLPTLDRADCQRSADGTVKFLWRLADGLAVESVWIPEGRRRTLCISSQAGCAFGCVFCATGRMGFQRHLAPWEIAGQVREMVLDPEFGRPTNVVFMGMGEPLHNWKAVDTALTILNHRDGFGIGARRITVSTVGVVPRLADLADRPEQFRVAISLHAATSERRARLLPIERKYPLPELMGALEGFARRITFEYVLIAGANDSPSDADALAALAEPLGAHVNLLPLHPGGNPGLAPVTAAVSRQFATRLREQGIEVTERRSRGLDISAACGQLRFEADGGGIASEDHAHI